MPNYTPKLNLEKPLPTEAYNISVNNANADKIDTSFGNMEAGLDYYFAQNGSGTFTGLNNLTGYIHNVDHIGENMRVVFKNTTANTGNVTITINGLGPIPVLRKDSTQIPAGGLKANTVYMIYFDGTNFLLLGDGGEYGTAAAPQVLSGYTIGTENGLVSGTIPTKSAQTYTPGLYDQTINSGQYLGGAQTIKGDLSLYASNIRSGATIFGVSGTFSNLDPLIAATSNDIRQWKSAIVNGSIVNGSLIDVAGGNTITPSTSNQTAVTGNSIVTNAITVAGSPNLIASNIKEGVNIFGVTGNFKGTETGFTISSSSGINFQDYGGTVVSRNFIFVSDLGFKPSYILVKPSTGDASQIVYDNRFTANARITMINNKITTGTTVVSIREQDFIENGMFTLPVPAANTYYTWTAVR